MKMFMLKSLMLASLMFISVLFGMQQANEGIHKMKGYEDPEFKSAFSVKENESGSFETAILGNDISSHDLEQKRKKLEEMKAFNLFSSIGKKLADGVSFVMEKTVELITGK
ncbi:YqxA family protein [Bacillus sp. ISL-35]|uniref:YqxA family protein n=1 Tax=Bacillus sp. ISL-35 TaxID=2819122 RepID=UPI001BE8F24F|nr:YqxA family protein [Bacillus sp. ISL-35]MBT2677432.1 YqxA family protein [Bacillus sp. ISL-35]MBT2702180.1 YqxA family protein [Chryseobacterium sp. ISL-80]